jgi:hypothetical protein
MIAQPQTIDFDPRHERKIPSTLEYIVWSRVCLKKRAWRILGIIDTPAESIVWDCEIQ